MTLVKKHCWKKGVWSFHLKHTERTHCLQKHGGLGDSPGFAEWAVACIGGGVALAGRAFVIEPMG